MYQSGLTIKDALEDVSKNLYVLPAIQREFVWKPEQICRLFDSLMQGYPFGTFLFWKVEPDKSAQFKFYGFVQNYHERDAAHCPELGTLPNRELTAVLDGQQRLTALNVGLRGSVALKEPNKRWTNPNAFPKKTLHLDLLATNEDDDGGNLYSFRFLEPQKAANDVTSLWYPVPDILSVSNASKLSQWLFAKFQARGIGSDEVLFNTASDSLHRLYQIVHTVPNLTFFTEKSQELDRVLRIFIRMNSGGTVLSYSDLLLSIAVAQWTAPMPGISISLIKVKRLGSTAVSFRHLIKNGRCLLRSPRYAAHSSNIRRTLTNIRHKRIARLTGRRLRRVKMFSKTVNAHRSIMHCIHNRMQLSERKRTEYVLKLRSGGSK